MPKRGVVLVLIYQGSIYTFKTLYQLRKITHLTPILCCGSGGGFHLCHQLLLHFTFHECSGGGRRFIRHFSLFTSTMAAALLYYQFFTCPLHWWLIYLVNVFKFAGSNRNFQPSTFVEFIKTAFVGVQRKAVKLSPAQIKSQLGHQLLRRTSVGL
jgi:hypothetical protein